MRNGTGAPVRLAALPVRAIFAGGLALGIAGDVLLRGRGGPGLNLFLLAVGLAAALVALSRRAGLSLSREAFVMLGVGIAFAATLILRASEALRAFAFLAAAVAFALPALRAGAAWLGRSGVSEQIEAVVWAGVNALAGGFRLAGAALARRSPAGASAAASAGPGGPAPHPARRVLLGLLLAIPFLLAFGALFMSADRFFAQLVTRFVDLDYREIASHVFLTAVLTWLACGCLAGFLAGTRLVTPGDVLGSRPAAGIVEIGTALALVDLLFLLFVSVQFRYLFGGSGLVEVPPASPTPSTSERASGIWRWRARWSSRPCSPPTGSSGRAIGAIPSCSARWAACCSCCSWWSSPPPFSGFAPTRPRTG